MLTIVFFLCIPGGEVKVTGNAEIGAYKLVFTYEKASGSGPQLTATTFFESTEAGEILIFAYNAGAFC